MLRNLITVQYLCFHKSWRRNLNAYLNIHSHQQSGFIIEMMIQKNLKGLERL